MQCCTQRVGRALAGSPERSLICIRLIARHQTADPSQAKGTTSKPESVIQTSSTHTATTWPSSDFWAVVITTLKAFTHIVVMWVDSVLWWMAG